MEQITKIASKLGISEEALELFGRHKAKVNPEVIKNVVKAKLILVTAVNPTPAGEGKTTTTIGLGDALNSLGKKCVIALREPSLGPIFGMKGGATGGGRAQVTPIDEINMHFTGDMHAITAANNLLCAVVDNHLFQGNELGIQHIVIRKCMDMNYRELRDAFDITAACEVMATLCLAKDEKDLRERLGKIVVAYDMSNAPLFAKQFKVVGAMAALLKDAIKPNLVQTLEGSPVFIHGGPFANIAHGCNSIIATKTAMQLGDYVATEAGFGADLGAEKFLNIKCRAAGLAPSAIVVVATVRALKFNGEGDLAKGIPNLIRHIQSMQKFGPPVIVAINKFADDTDAELAMIVKECIKLAVPAVTSTVFANGGQGGVELANMVLAAVDSGKKVTLKHTYELADPITTKIEKIVKEVYGGDGVEYESDAKFIIDAFQKHGFGNLPICMAKTPASFTDDPKKLGAPTGFKITVRDVHLSNGAGFVVIKTGKIMTMPGLPKVPNSESFE